MNEVENRIRNFLHEHEVITLFKNEEDRKGWGQLLDELQIPEEAPTVEQIQRIIMLNRAQELLARADEILNRPLDQDCISGRHKSTTYKIWIVEVKVPAESAPKRGPGRPKKNA